MKTDDEEMKNRTVGCVFVGNLLSFSDMSLRLIEADFPCINCIRTAAVNDLLLMGQAQSVTVRLIIIDEWMLQDLIKVIPQLRAAFPTVYIALGFRNPEMVRPMIGLMQANPSWGKISFLPMNLNVDAWLSVVRLLVSGECYFPEVLFSHEQPMPETPPQKTVSQHEITCSEKADDIQLTARELQVLESAADGKQNKIIADELNLSQHTVKLHMHHIIAKLGVHNRTEAANWFHDRKLGI
jgi:DNA-binding NarL/FixJ family response regulator